MSRPEVGADGPPEPDRRHRRVRGRARRHPARGPRLRPQRRRRRDQRHRRPPRPRRDRLDRPAGERQGRRRRGRAALGDGGPQRRRHVTSTGWAATAPAGSCCSAWRRRRARTASTASTATPAAAARRSASSRHRGRADRAPPRAADDAGPVHAPDPGHVRRAGADERGERAGRGRRGVGRRARTSTTSGRACGPSRRRSSRRPAGSTCSTSAGSGVVIDYCHNVDGMRQLADFVERMMVEPQSKAGRIGVERPGRPAIGRAIGVIGIPGDRRDEDQREYGAIAATAFDEIIVREDKNLRGRAPGETAANVIEGVRTAKATRRARAAAPRSARRDDRGPDGAPPGDPGRPRGVLRRRRDRASTARRWPRAGQARGGDRVRRSRRAGGARGLSARRRSASPRPLLQPRDELGQLRRDVDRPRAQLAQQLEDLLALLVAHQHDHPRRVGPRPSRPSPPVPARRAAPRSRTRRPARPSRATPPALDPGQDLADDRLAGPAAQVLERLLDRDALRPLGRRSARSRGACRRVGRRPSR